jgi:hypothetical protein
VFVDKAEMFNRLNIPKSASASERRFLHIPGALTRQWASVRLVFSLQLVSSSVPSFHFTRCSHLDQNPSAGVIFMCFTIDYRILHVKITPEATRDATHFYTLFYNAPPAIKVGLPFVCFPHLLTNRLKGLPSLDDGNWHHLFVGKAS